MARIKKKGLDYFPLNTDFIHDRAVRRLMKREGDSALGVLVEVFSYIYADEGYYVRADRLFYEDLSAGLYQNSSADVERIVCLAVDYGLFDSGLFERCHILTSVEIQRQYLFSTRRRSTSHLEAAYCLLPGVELSENEQDAKKKIPFRCGETDPRESIIGDDNVTFIPQNVTLIPQNVTSGTHSIAKNSKAKHSKEYPLLNPPLKKTGEEMTVEAGREEISSVSSCGNGHSGSCRQREWTQASIDSLLPPADGTPRNYEGLLDNLRLYGVPPAEQYAIIRKSDFGAIGDAVWKGIATLRGSSGKIKLPGRYLLSVVNRRGEEASMY